MNYKDTLNLPKTKFSMKANLPNREPQFLARWQEMDLFKQLREMSKGRQKYVLHDGPPYANGNIHTGTALNKVLKDIIVRSRQMMGFDSVYVPGWDCHGLPIEHEVSKKLGSKMERMSQGDVRRECRAYATKFIDIQRKEFMRLGCEGDWFDPYLTMAYPYESIIAREFTKFFFNGSVYRSKKPIYWCNSCKTALAEAEVEYADHKSPSIYVAFPLIDDLSAKYPALKGLETSLVIWTTTPWTIPANLAIAAHPEFDYVAVKHGNKAYIMAERLAPLCMDIFGLEGWEKLCEIKPIDIEGIKAKHPLYDRESVGVLADYVTLESGTGLVHTAPGHGREDYETGLKYGLDILSPLNDSGQFLQDVGHFAGQTVWEANPNVIEKLKEAGALMASQDIEHSYPHCWRCKEPVIYRATAQWFISMEEHDLRKNTLDAIQNKVSFVPKWGKDRIYGMIENRPDWCISRQRAWGVPITVFKCEDCGEPVLTKEMAESVLGIFHEKGADAWFDLSVEELTPKGSKCTSCGSSNLTKENDILDVWFDSGCSHAAVLEPREELTWPADMYLEGSDQHRGWFHSSILCAMGTRGTPPYRSVLTHGFVVDKDGRKMSKSLGNTIPPKQIIQQYGAEILRLWVAAEDYTDDIRISDEILKQLADAYRRIRNTMRFMLGVLADFNPATDQVDPAEMSEMDRLMLHKLSKMNKRLNKSYEDFVFHHIYHALHNFCSVDLSGFYLDISKDLLYTWAADSKERRATQTVIYQILTSMVRTMAPILCFTSEEVWGYIPGAKDEFESVHMAGLPEVDENLIKEELAGRWNQLIALRAEVNKALDIARKDKVVGNSLEASLELCLPRDLEAFAKENQDHLTAITMVSELKLVDSLGDEAFSSELIQGLKVSIKPTSFEKCPRCWKHRQEVGPDQEICDDCQAALATLA
jgi:isoleucyl-tRNA synthetase